LQKEAYLTAARVAGKTTLTSLGIDLLHVPRGKIVIETEINKKQKTKLVLITRRFLQPVLASISNQVTLEQHVNHVERRKALGTCSLKQSDF
jgi:ABC-type dipeptide/oligopeptide/nickel transport system ATPase subunit